jgi:hypothetical protein
MNIPCRTTSGQQFNVSADMPGNALSTCPNALSVRVYGTIQWMHENTLS